MSQRPCMPKYIPELDGLRGVAIIAVMLFHANIPFFKGDKFLQGGFIGVDIFFVLSGFLITSILISEFDRTGSINLKNFYIRRFLRLAPALTALLIVFCLISFMVLNEEEAKKNYIDAFISAFYLSNWARAFLIHPPDFLGHTWSLSIEEQFYVLWPIILFLFLNVFKERKFVIISIAIIALLSWLLRIYLANNGASIARLFNGLDTRADALMVGCTVAAMLSSRLFNSTVPALLYRLLSILSVLSVLGLCTFAILSNWYVLWMHYLGFFIVELLTAIVIFDIIVNPDCFLKNLLRMKWLVWVGSISYGLYLWHYPVFRAISSMGFQGWAKFTVGMLSTLMLSWLSYRTLELPVLKLKTRFTGSNSKRATLPSTGNAQCAETCNT